MIASARRRPRRLAQRLLESLSRVISWVLWPLRWLVVRGWRFLRRRSWPGRVVTLLATLFVVLVALLAVSVPWPGYLFTPPFRAVYYAPVNDLQRLRPGTTQPPGLDEAEGCRQRQDVCRRTATVQAQAGLLCEEILAQACAIAEPTWQGWTREDRLRFYYHAQGSAQVMLARMRYAWFVNLERPFGRERLATPENMARYGFLTEIRQRPDPDWNPGNLPVGFAKYYDAKVGAELLDFTCSLCHTGELHYNGTAIRIDGGQATHAVTSMKPGQFQADLMASMLATYWNPWKFARFARGVIPPLPAGGDADGDAFDAAKDRLREEFGASIHELLANAWTDLKHGNYPVFEGYGRTDATQRIANTVFGRHISADNYRPATAPVSYPHLWDIAKFNWVQWEGYASQPMARNINESLGVGARLDLFDEFGAPLPAHLRYDTSIHPDRLHEIERTLAKLEAPKWPGHLFGPIDFERARAGRVLFDVHCRHCHGPHLTAHDTPPTHEHQADPGLDINLRHDADGRCTLLRRGEPVAVVDARQCLNLHNPQRITDGDGEPLYALDAKGRVIGVRGNEAVPEWRIEVIPVTDIGTDRHAALNFSGRTYDVTRLGWTPDELRRLCVADDIVRTLDPKRITAVVGLNLMSTAITNRYFEQNPPQSDRELFRYMGYGIFDYPRTDPARLKNYKSRPLHGIWATPPFLHNGSVRTVYQMISPRSEREAGFWSGTREYDPADLGYRDLEVPGAVRFDTRVTGNDNTGHEFRDGCQKDGVIGPYLEPQDRRRILEYLKVMDYVPDGAALEPGGHLPYEPALCRGTPDVAACEFAMTAARSELQAKYPAWGSESFRNSTWEAHCSDDTAVYGSHLPASAPDDEWETWKLASGCSLFDLYRNPDGPFRGN